MKYSILIIRFCILALILCWFCCMIVAPDLFRFVFCGFAIASLIFLFTLTFKFFKK